MASADELKSERNDHVYDTDPCEGENYHPVAAWMAVVAACFLMLVGSSSLNLLTPVLSLVLDEFQQTAHYGAMLGSIESFLSLLVVFPIGWAVNKWGYRPLGYAAYGLIILSAALGLFCTPTADALLFVRVLQGVVYAIPFVLCIYAVTQWMPKRKLALPIALIAAMPQFARILVLQFSKLVVPTGNWRGQFALMVLIGVVGLVLFAIFLKPGPGYVRAEQERRERGRLGHVGRGPLLAAAKTPYIWAITVVMVCFSIGSRGFDPFSNMIFVENCGVSNATASDMGSLFSTAKIVSGILIGFLITKFNDVAGKMSAFLLTVYFFGIACGFLINSPLQGWLFVVIVGLVGCAPTFCQICLPLFAESPAVLAMALVIYDFVGKYLAAIVAPYIMSGIQVATGSWVMCAVPVAVCGIVATVFCWVLGLAMDRKNQL